MMLETIIENRYTITAVILFTVGFGNLLLHQNLIRKVIAFNIMDASTFLLLATRGFIEGRSAAILTEGGTNTALYVNPIPAGLVHRNCCVCQRFGILPRPYPADIPQIRHR